MSTSAASLRLGLFAALFGTAVGVRPAASQTVESTARRILSSEIALNASEASLRLEFDDGSSVLLTIRDGQAWADGRALGEANRRGRLDVPWRELLEQAAESPTSALPGLLTAWVPPENHEAGIRLEAALDAALAGTAAATPAPAQQARAEIQLSDSMRRLQERIAELEQRLDRARAEVVEIPAIPRAVQRAEPGPGWMRPFTRLWRGIVRAFSIIMIGALLLGVGVTIIFFGGRRYIEGVADTARAATTRSLVVGVAASFLVIPAYILGVLALVISIVGIPAILLWLPLFPVAVILAALLGYMAVGHAAGEALAERRLYGADWFRRGNSYYFLMTGLTLLLAPFVAAELVSILGIGFLEWMLYAIGGVMTWAALSIGLGAVLISRVGTNPLTTNLSAEPDVFAEETTRA